MAAANPSEKDPPLWNIWYTLMVISAGITILAAILEALGVWRDLGVVVGLAGTAATVAFGAIAPTRAAFLRFDRRLDAMHDTLQHILKILDKRLPDRDAWPR